MCISLHLVGVFMRVWAHNRLVLVCCTLWYVPVQVVQGTVHGKRVSCCCLPSHQGDVEVPIPRYFLSENAKAIKEREKLLGTILAKMGPPDLKTKAGDEATMTTEDAVKLIQVHERARQGRLRAKLMKDIRYTHTHTHTETHTHHTHTVFSQSLNVK